MASLFSNAQGQESLKSNFYVCAFWEHHSKLKAWECLFHVQSVPKHHQHKQGINLPSKYMIATGLSPFSGTIFFLPSLFPLAISFLLLRIWMWQQHLG